LKGEGRDEGELSLMAVPLTLPSPTGGEGFNYGLKPKGG
jgi:hypothetical protein